jgi:hypothetical protein
MIIEYEKAIMFQEEVGLKFNKEGWWITIATKPEMRYYWTVKKFPRMYGSGTEETLEAAKEVAEKCFYKHYSES